MSYVPPSWSGPFPPDNTLSFEVIKAGVVLDNKIDFPSSKSHLTFGRDADAVDVPMLHGSISRMHCVVQFSETGEVFLYDLGSTHGTFLNKERLAPRTYTKVELNSMVRFGESTRLCFLRSSRPQDMEHPRKLMKISPNLSPTPAVTNTEPVYTAKQKEKLAKIERLKRSIANVEANQHNLLRKQMESELTEGQTHALMQADSLLERYTKEMLTLETQLQESVTTHAQNVREAELSSKQSHFDMHEQDEDDDCYDLTKANKRPPTAKEDAIFSKFGSGGKSSRSRKRKQLEPYVPDKEEDEDPWHLKPVFARLTASLALQTEPQQVQEAMQLALKHRDFLSTKLGDMRARTAQLSRDAKRSDDTLAQFMTGVEDEATEVAQQRIKGYLRKLEASYRQLEEFLPTAEAQKRARSFLAGDTSAFGASTNNSAPTIGGLAFALAKKKEQDSIVAATEEHDAVRVNDVKEEEKKPALTAKEKLIQKLQARSSSNVFGHKQSKEADRARRLEDLKSEILASSSSSTEQPATNNQNVNKRRKVVMGKQQQANFELPIERVSEWVPPAKQTGDGRTSLNDKLGY